MAVEFIREPTRLTREPFVPTKDMQDACRKTDNLPMWVLYERPKDSRDRFLVRLWYSLPEVAATDIALSAPTKEDLEMAIERISGARWHWIPRSADDDPVIVGVWL